MGICNYHHSVGNTVYTDTACYWDYVYGYTSRKDFDGGRFEEN